VTLRTPTGPDGNAGSDAAQGVPAPIPPRKRKVRLADLADVRREFARLYRDAVNGEIDAKQARMLASVLYMLRAAFVADEVERRIEALEAEWKKRFSS
jgi:hypothetical protein